MDDQLQSIFRSLEIYNESKNQNILIANQRIADFEQQEAESNQNVANLERRIVELEQQVAELSDPNSGSVESSTETQVDFIRRVAEARTKFSKEAQEIIDAIDNLPASEPAPEDPAPEEV